MLFEIDPRVHASGGVGIQRFENPPVFLADNLLLRTVPVVHQIGVGNVILNKRLLFGGQKAQVGSSLKILNSHLLWGIWVQRDPITQTF